MQGLPITFTPYPDELMHSYYLRVARENLMEFDELRKFCEGTVVDKTRVRYDSLYELHGFLRLIKSNPLTIYSNHSVYPALYPFLKEVPRVIYAGLSLMDFRNYPRIWHRPFVHLVRKLKICSSCQKEDLSNYGESYLRRSHHVGDVSVCYKHKTPLFEIKNPFDPPFEIGQEVKVSSIEDELKFAEFIHLLFNPSFKKRDYWIKILESGASVNPLLDEYKNRILCGSSQLITKETEIIKEEVLSILKKDKLSPLQNGLGGFQEYTCEECGKSFISTPKLLQAGYSCPCKRIGKREEDVLKDIVVNGFNQRYTLLYQHHVAKFLHLLLFDHQVGKLLIVRPSNLLLGNFDGVRYCTTSFSKSCNNKPLSRKDLEEMGYRVSFEKDSYIIVCQTCGKTTKEKIKETYIEHCYECEKEKMVRLLKVTETEPGLRYDDVIFSSVHRLSKRVKVYEEMKKELEGFVEPLSLVLTKDSHSNKIYIKHDRCGHITVKTRSTYIPEQYFRCRGCNSAIYRKDALKVFEKGLLDRAKHVLEDFGGRLSVHRVVDPLKKIVEIKHEECRHIKRLNYKALTEIKSKRSSVCKVCKNSVLSDAHYKENRVVSEEAIKAFSHELILENPDRINLGKIELRHTKCGGVFPRTITVLRKSKSVLCPVCNKNIHRKDPKKF